MTVSLEIRPGEIAVDLPDAADAQLYFIGEIHTPWTTPSQCPRRGDREEGPLCRIEIFDPWRQALQDIARHSHLQILYWMHLARRDLVLQSPRHAGLSGTFALRSPNRPNPIAASIVSLAGVEGATLIVRGLDCIDGTPLVDVKPEHCPHAAPKPDGSH